MTNESSSIPPKKKPRVQLKPMSSHPAKDPAHMISSYRKRMQVGPFIIGGLIVLMFFAGIILLIIYMTSGNAPKFNLFATATPTVTITPSQTPTATFTATATETLTPTQTLTPTPSEPFEYVIQEGENLFSISEKFNLGDFGIQKIFTLNPEIDPLTANISIGQKIKIPNPGYELPTATPVPSDLLPGTKITYIIQPGDTIASIASKFNSTFEDIIKENKIADANSIKAYQQIIVRVNLVTPTNPPRPTITQGPSPTPPSPFTPTPDGQATLTVTPTP